MSHARMSWMKLLESQDKPLILPAAHDALTSLLIAKAGFAAYQIGGFAMVAARFGIPDLGLTSFGEELTAVQQIMHVSPLPVLVDADDGYGDAKNMTRVVQTYEELGVSAMFFEDQTSPKRCGHLPGKKVMPAEDMVNKIKAAVAARRNPDTFIMARTDAIETDGVKEAVRRARLYLEAGANGIYMEAMRTTEELEEVGAALGQVPLAVSVMEGGGKVPVLPPQQYAKMGYSMLLYSTTVLFPTVAAIQDALQELKNGTPMSFGVNLEEFEQAIDMQSWFDLEQKYPVGG